MNKIKSNNLTSRCIRDIFKTMKETNITQIGLLEYGEKLDYHFFVHGEESFRFDILSNRILITTSDFVFNIGEEDLVKAYSKTLHDWVLSNYEKVSIISDKESFNEESRL